MQGSSPSSSLLLQTLLDIQEAIIDLTAEDIPLPLLIDRTKQRISVKNEEKKCEIKSESLENKVESK